MFEGLLLPWQQIYHLAFHPIFRTTPEVSSKLYFVEICQISEKLWLFNHKRADFWLPNFAFKRSLLSLLNIMPINKIEYKQCLSFALVGAKTKYGVIHRQSGSTLKSLDSQ